MNCNKQHCIHECVPDNTAQMYALGYVVNIFLGGAAIIFYTGLTAMYGAFVLRGILLIHVTHIASA
jgi:hypothetical protein